MSCIDTHAELLRARAHTDALFDLVAERSLYDRPVAERHRLIFYVGHVDTFDWNQIARGVLGEASFHPTFDRLFEAGIDPPPGQAPQDKPGDWPSLNEVRAYVKRTRDRLDELWAEAPAERQQVALEHRWMHAETLCYLLHRLRFSQKRRPVPTAEADAPPASHAPLDVPAGRATLGQRTGAFGWDNEFPSHQVDVPAFTIDRHKVTNADYLRFVADGGPVPPFWREREGRWWLLRMFEEVPLPPDEPVYATHRQASDYAQWASASLPTEAQWHRAAYGDSSLAYPWGDHEPEGGLGNFDFVAWDSVAVTAHPASASAVGAEQMVGNGWEWTSTPFAGFDGFAPSSYYPGYSANFFDDDHWVLKGGSPRTARCLLRRSFRNWFRGDYPFAYTTFRLVRP